MNAYKSRPLKYPWPSMLYTLALLIALGLHRLFPLQVVNEGRTWLQILGVLLFVAGLALIFWALRKLLHHRTSILSTRRTSHLVTSGPFRLTRNPVYLGYALVMLALGLIASCAWMIAASLITATLIHLYVIRREEKHLLARFGFEFERYCRRTRAWI